LRRGGEAPDRGGQGIGREALFRRRRRRHSRSRARREAHRHAAISRGEFLELLRKDKNLDWTFLSPSAVIAPGERTGKFRLGKDQLLTHDKGSNISWEDYAIAAVDELEKPTHIRQRFTVGY
jgi:putative NADH-flavin reductase